MGNTEPEPMSYLTAPLCEVALHHLTPDETVLTAIYAEHTDLLAHDRWLGFTWARHVHLPRRAFILTMERAMIVEDPTDTATSTADHEYLFASCPLNRIMLFALRSHLLDCALTLVMANPNGAEHITIGYNGVSQNAFLIAVAYMRALIDGQSLPSYTRPNETYTRERMTAQMSWHPVLVELGIRQENALTCYLTSNERVQEWLAMPAIDKSTWMQRLSIGAHEQPPAVLVRTDRQILLIKEVRRTVRGQATYGSDAWLIPLKRLYTGSIVPNQKESEVQFVLEHLGVTEVVRLLTLPELAERALTLVRPSLRGK